MRKASVLVALATLVVFWPQRADPLPGLPRTFLWAWERPENLDFIDPHTTGVAFLARTVFLRNGCVSVQPRRNPLRYTPGATLMAVVRVDSNRSALPEAEPVAAAIAEAAAIPGVRGLQVDFDATLSQRAFYRDVLHRVRSKLPKDMPLSMTALASWCEADHWIDGLPVTEAVPMLFRMGPGERAPSSFRPRIEHIHPRCRPWYFQPLIHRDSRARLAQPRTEARRRPFPRPHPEQHRHRLRD